MREPPLITVILATYNRREVTLATLAQVIASAGPNYRVNVVAVDNGSRDGTADAIKQRFPGVTVLRAPRNLGSCAKALGIPHAQGEYVVFLDDDSHPRPGSLSRMLHHFEANPDLGAAGFRVHLPDGSQESAALPEVFVGCGVGFRTRALLDAGGLDVDLFMQAEEYHLAFRLVNSGWSIRLFDDLHVEHLKTPRARRRRRTTYLDTRNNLLLAARYLPDPYYTIYAEDWRQRYGWLARSAGHRSAFVRGWVAGVMRGRRDRRDEVRAAQRLRPAAMEALFRLEFVRQKLTELHAEGVRRVVLADLGKNVYAFHAGAAQAGLKVPAIIDDGFAAAGRSYRGTPVVPSERVDRLAPDALMIANMSPVHANRTRQRLLQQFSLPIHDWFSRPAVPAPTANRALRAAAIPATIRDFD